MKNIYYLLALVIMCFASCKPLTKTYNDIDNTPIAPGSTIPLTLTVSEYQLLPTTNLSYKLLSFKSSADANLYIPTILTAKYPNVANSVGVNATFALQPSSSNIAVPDSTYAHVAITLATPADYVYPTYILNGMSIAGNSAAYFTTTTAQGYLSYKFPSPAANQMVILNYLYFETGVTATAGTQTTDTYIYLGGTWTKIYTVSATQYASINRGANNWFLATDVPSLVYYVNGFLKSDPSVMVSVKTGDIKYVSYRYTTTYQKVLALTYDGLNWVPKLTLAYLKLSGVWLPDPTINITMPDSPSSWTLVGASNIGSTGARSNLLSHGDFDIRPTATTSNWSDADIASAIILELPTKIANPVIGLPYRVTYYVYTGSTAAASKVFVFDGTSYNLQK